MIGKGRLRTGGRRRSRPKSQIGQLLQDWWQPGSHSMDWNAVAASGDKSSIIVDNSADFSNRIAKFTKLKINWWADPGDTWDSRVVLLAIGKRDEDDSTVPALDGQETIRELRNEKRLLRGPFVVHLHQPAVEGDMYAAFLKTIVLKNIVLDKEEDLVFYGTNISGAFQAAQQVLKIYPTGYVRLIN